MDAPSPWKRSYSSYFGGVAVVVVLTSLVASSIKDVLAFISIIYRSIYRYCSLRIMSSQVY